MRVAIVNPVWKPGVNDSDTLLSHFPTLTGWAESLVAAGAASVTVYQRFSSSVLIERSGVRYELHEDRGGAHPGWSTQCSVAFRSAVAHSGADVVHVNGILFPEFVRSLRCALPAKTALVMQDHGGFDMGAATLLRRAWLSRGMAACDAVLVSSSGQAERLRRQVPITRRALVADVMESSTTLRPVSRDDAQRVVGISGSPALLWVGRLNENKDPLTVLRGFATWAQLRPSATLTMVFHEGELEGAVRNMVESTPALRERVRLVGRVAHEQVAQYYSAADLFVLGSHHEGSGYAVIEALACGAIPVITDIAPFRPLTADGAIGALWETGNSVALRVALERVMARDLRRERTAAIELFARHFTWPHIGERALSIYREAIASRAARRSAAPDRTQT